MSTPSSHWLTEQEERPRADEVPEPLPRRPLPDYDGRGKEPTTAGDALLWIPRVLFAPLYLLSEFVIRRPLGALARLAEQGHPPQDPLDLFSFGPGRDFALVPTFLIDFGLQPSVGLYFRWDDVLDDRHDVRVFFGTWGPNWLSGIVKNRYEPAHERWALEWRNEATRRPDGLFWGIGPDAPQRESRFFGRHLESKLELEARPWRASRVVVSAAVRERTFQSRKACCGASVQDRVDQGTFDALPPGFGGFTIYEQGVELVLDTRRERPKPGSGVVLRIAGSHAFDLEDPVARRWVTYSASAGGYVDLTGRWTLLSAIATVSFVDPIEGEIPFTELVEISDDGPMQGFIQHRLIGRSAATLLLQYEWPIWHFLNAVVYVAFGNVFRSRLAGFDLDRLRMSYAFTLAAVGSLDHHVEATIAWGTDPIREGPDIDTFRFTIGATRTF